MQLEILYHDSDLVVINKPHGLLVHRSPYAGDADEYAIQTLRDQLQQMVFPCHRLDRKTAGVLLFALNQEINRAMQQQFADGRVHKKYLAIVRGHTPAEGVIDYALTNDKGKTQDAITHYKTLKNCEIPLAFGKFPTSRYSLVEVEPKTGRMHQIRKHMAHIFHPIIGDRPHGCNKQNRLFKEHFTMDIMLLHASEICFTHPVSGIEICVEAPLGNEFRRMLSALHLI